MRVRDDVPRMWRPNNNHGFCGGGGDDGDGAATLHDSDPDMPVGEKAETMDKTARCA